jgi:transcriptional regulator with XRE-family HTH domain
MDILLNIKKIVEEKRISQTELAKKLDVSRQVLYNIWTDRTDFSVPFLIRLSQVLEVPIEILLGLEINHKDADVFIYDENDLSLIEKEIEKIDVTGEIKNQVKLNKYKNFRISKKDVLMQFILSEARINVMKIQIDRLKKEVKK